MILSAETYVREPEDLWGARWRLGARRAAEPDSAASLLALLDREGLAGAVLYPRAALRAYAEILDTELLSSVLSTYNDWILGLARDGRGRLAPGVLINVDEPEQAVREIERTRAAGAAAFVIPSGLGEGRRYDQDRYEPLWGAAAAAGRPFVFISGCVRPMGRDLNEAAGGKDGTLAARLAWRATAVFPPRRAATAITYAGVFARHPALRLGVVGCGAAWTIPAAIRADEIYEVRPERTGPEASAVEGAGVGPAVGGADRQGKVGMAVEGWGYKFPPGERFSTHFRRHVFSTFHDDALGVRHRGLIGAGGMLWGLGPSREPGASERALELLREVPEAERSLFLCDNTRQIHGLL